MTRSPTLAFALLCMIIQPTFARSPMGADDPWNPQHVSSLPAEVRAQLTRLCPGAMAAQHYFATYRENSRVLRLHFENFRCDETGSLCSNKGCLHQEYELRAGRYQLERTYYSSVRD